MQSSLDSGSQVNLLTEKFMKRLKIKGKSRKLPVAGLNEANHNIQKSAELTLKSLRQDSQQSWNVW